MALEGVVSRINPSTTTPLLARGWFRPRAKTKKSWPVKPPETRVPPKLKLEVRAFGGLISPLWYFILRSNKGHNIPNLTITNKGSHTRQTNKGQGMNQIIVKIHHPFWWIMVSTYQHPISIDMDKTWSDQPRIKGFIVSHEHGVKLRTIPKEFTKDKNM